MNTETIENPPAFLDPCGAHPGAMPPSYDKGMTLRDYFAAKVISECVKNTALGC